MKEPWSLPGHSDERRVFARECPATGPLYTQYNALTISENRAINHRDHPVRLVAIRLNRLGNQPSHFRKMQDSGSEFFLTTNKQHGQNRKKLLCNSLKFTPAYLFTESTKIRILK